MISCDYKWALSCNSPPNFRERFCNLIRALCDRFDGRISVAISIDSTPVIAPGQKRECILFGLNHIRYAVADTVKAEAYEVVLAEVMKAKHGTVE